MKVRPRLISPEPPASPLYAHDEFVLVSMLRQGRLDALARAFDLWHHRIRVLARRLLWDDAAAEDVVQEVFESLPRAVSHYRGDAGLETFLLAIAVKRARSHQRSVIRRRKALDWLARRDVVPTGDPEYQTYRRQLGSHLLSALDRLTLAQRESFVLCEIEGLTSAHVSDITNIPEPTVRTRLFHARRRLRAFLSKEHEENNE